MKHTSSQIEPPRLRAGRASPRHAAVSIEADRRIIGGVIALIVAAVVAGVALWPAGGSGRQAGMSTIGVDEPSWEQRLAKLYDVRAEAFAVGDVDLLGQVYTPDSRQLRADLETIESLGAQQRTVVGFAPALIAIESVSETSSTAVLVVRDKIEPFVIVDKTGTEMQVAGRASSLTTFTLRRIGEAWLIATAERSVS